MGQEIQYEWSVDILDNNLVNRTFAADSRILNSSFIESRYEAVVCGLTPRSTARYRRKKWDNRLASGGFFISGPFLDEVAKACLVSPGDLAHDILSQLQIPLRAGQSNMTKVGRQERQFGAKVNVLLAPQEKPEDRK